MYLSDNLSLFLFTFGTVDIWFLKCLLVGCFWLNVLLASLQSLFMSLWQRMSRIFCIGIVTTPFARSNPSRAVHSCNRSDPSSAWFATIHPVHFYYLRTSSLPPWYDPMNQPPLELCSPCLIAWLLEGAQRQMRRRPRS